MRQSDIEASIENIGENYNMKERTLYWYWISKCESIGIKTIHKLLATFGNIKGIYASKQSQLAILPYLKDNVKIYLTKKPHLEELEIELRELEQSGIHFVSKEEPEFPKKLLSIYDAPYFLYYRGKLPREDALSIAIIGARDCSIYGKELAKKFASELAEHGVQVLSGLARGVDGYAHHGTILGGGETFAVVGNGLDMVYPKENTNLFFSIEQQGGILSEYPIGSNALAYHFPMRNRLIAGLSDGIFVIEAREKSGTLITVDYGLEQGKDIFALPGRIVDDLSKGCNDLIRSGAKLVTKVEDILEEYQTRFLGITKVEKKQKDNLVLTEKEMCVYQMLTVEPTHVDDIVNQTKMPLGEVMEQIILLELKHAICSTSAMSYIRTI